MYAAVQHARCHEPKMDMRLGDKGRWKWMAWPLGHWLTMFLYKQITSMIISGSVCVCFLGWPGRTEAGAHDR